MVPNCFWNLTTFFDIQFKNTSNLIFPDLFSKFCPKLSTYRWDSVYVTGRTFRHQSARKVYQYLIMLKGALISFSILFHFQKNVPNHFPQLFQFRLKKLGQGFGPFVRMQLKLKYLMGVSHLYEFPFVMTKQWRRATLLILLRSTPRRVNAPFIRVYCFYSFKSIVMLRTRIDLAGSSLKYVRVF